MAKNKSEAIRKNSGIHLFGPCVRILAAIAAGLTGTWARALRVAGERE